MANGDLLMIKPTATAKASAPCDEISVGGNYRCRSSPNDFDPKKVIERDSSIERRIIFIKLIDTFIHVGVCASARHWPRPWIMFGYRTNVPHTHKQLASKGEWMPNARHANLYLPCMPNAKPNARVTKHRAKHNCCNDFIRRKWADAFSVPKGSFVGPDGRAARGQKGN